MKVVRTKAEWPVFDHPVGFVPTMGAFHEGHLHLMRTAKLETGACAVSLFVNPTQFGPNEDFTRYPRDEARDFALAESAGVDWIFAPSVEEMYSDARVTLKVAGISDRWEGAHRPGHFDGVATVVAKFFHIIGATHAYFGEKDFQQCAVIAQMVRDLDFRIQLRFVETVRETDGLAMSSRNVYLSPEARKIAPSLRQALLSARDRIWAGEAPESVLADERSTLIDKGFEPDYLVLVDPLTLSPLNSGEVDGRLLVAAKLEKTRLIDNLGVKPLG